MTPKQIKKLADLPNYQFTQEPSFAREHKLIISAAKQSAGHYLTPAAVSYAIVPLSNLYDPALADLVRAAGVHHYARHMFLASGSPVWVLDEDTALALANSDTPTEKITDELLRTRLKLPFHGLYLVIPDSVLLTQNTNDGALLRVTGIYLSDGSYVDEGVRHPVIYVSAITNNTKNFKQLAEDRLISFYQQAISLSAQFELGASPEMMRTPETKQLVQLILNFLWALNSSYLDTTRVVRAPSKRRETLPGLTTVLPSSYTRVDLSRRARIETQALVKQRSAEDSGKSQRHALVRGHWHAYWKRDPEGYPILASRENRAGNIEYKVLYWILPYYVGDPTKATARWRSNPARFY